MKLLIIGILLSSSTIYAKDKKDFSEIKAKKLTRIGARISLLNAQKSCISAATDLAALKACRSVMKEFRDAQKEKRKAKKK